MTNRFDYTGGPAVEVREPGFTEAGVQQAGVQQIGGQQIGGGQGGEQQMRSAPGAGALAAATPSVSAAPNYRRSLFRR